MPTITIPLTRITLDLDHPVDLSALPEAEAIRLIKDSYGFLGTLLDVATHRHFEQMMVEG